MKTATVEVKYVNPPKDGKKFGSIKDTEGNTWPVKAERIRDFAPNGRYEFGYTEGDNGFKNIIGVKAVVAEPAPRGSFQHMDVAQPKTAPQTNSFYRPTSPEDKKSMFRCACVTAAIKSRQVNLTREGIAALIREVDGGYDDALGE